MSAAAPATHASGGWRPVIAAMAKSGSGSLGSSVLSALGNKIIAEMLGPSSIALIATLQQVRDAAVTGASANGRTALVRGVSALERNERREYLRTALVIFVTGSLAAASLLIVARARIAGWVGISPDRGLVGWLAVPVLLTTAAVFLSSLANALGEIGKLAWSQVLVSALTAAAAWPVARALRAGSDLAIHAWLAVTAGASVLLAGRMLLPHAATLRAWAGGQGPWWNWPAARHFFSISAAMLTTGLLGSVVLVALRARIIRAQGLGAAGIFDAAWGISMNHVSLVLASLQTYYLPALARAPSREERVRHMAQVLILATVVMAPMVVALEWAKPQVVALFYSSSFQGSAALLRWMLVGDYLKVTSWVLAIPMLAVADIGAFMATDIAAQAVFLLCSFTFSWWFSASESTALAFLTVYAVNLLICYCYVRLRHGFRCSWKLAGIWWSGLTAVVLAAAFSAP